VSEGGEAGGGGIEPEILLEAIVLPIWGGDFDDGGGAVGGDARGSDVGCVEELIEGDGGPGLGGREGQGAGERAGGEEGGGEEFPVCCRIHRGGKAVTRNLRREVRVDARLSASPERLL
jgi:hypothetical protein